MRKIETHKLSFQVHVVIQTVGKGGDKRGIRRLLLIDGQTGLLCELPTAFIYRNHPTKSFNTHKAILRDLAFYLEWVSVRKKRNKKWLVPEERVKQNKLALSKKEIDDLCRWCQLTAKELAKLKHKETKSVQSIPAGKSVEVATTNNRIQHICEYLLWLTDEFIEGDFDIDDDVFVKSIEYKKKIASNFERHLSNPKKSPPVLSLNEDETKILVGIINSYDVFPYTPHGNRDRLITRLLYESGIRAGELLKLRCEDITPSYQIDQTRSIGLIDVIRRPNDSEDERINEPSVKTLPGPVTISKDLANSLVDYITNERRVAIDNRQDNFETPYLFVCHSGVNIGKPISQRNLNRIFEKLKNAPGLPDAISPHVLRHTHFTQISEIASNESINANDVMINRGHWSTNSKMPGKYTLRQLIKQSADLIAKRDEIIEGKNRD